MSVGEALLAIAASDREQAIQSAAAVNDAAPEAALAKALLRFLDRGADSGVYEEPSSFQAFIDNGDNPDLYTATIAHLARLHSQLTPASVADIGCGDGRVTAGALDSATTTVHLVEPSGDLLAQACGRSDWAKTKLVSHETTAAGFLAELGSDEQIDLVQSTFAMHTIPTAERPSLLAQLGKHTSHVVVVEFDVPAFTDHSEEHAAYTADRFQKGIAEYPDHPEVVDGFLMSVLVAQFDPAQRRHTFEGPAASWATSFEDAGFDTTITPLFNYWWAPAFALEAVRR